MSEIRIFKSKWKGVKMIVVSSLFVIPAAFFLYRGHDEDSYKLWLAVAFFGLGYPLGLSFILDRRPQLIISETGIFNRNLSDKIINWKIIKDVYLASINRQSFICLKVDDQFAVARSKGRLYRSVVKLNKELGFQELNIWLNNADVNPEKLLALVQQLIHADHAQRKLLLASGML